MKLFTALLLSTFLLAACSQKPGKLSGKIKILVTILPEKSFVEKIAGDDFDVTVLVPPGANPAVYSLLPSQMVDVSQSAVWFRMGYLGFELSTADKLRELNPAMKIVDLSDGMDIISFMNPDNPSRKTGHDPHIWLSPGNVKIMAARMLEELTVMNPAGEKKYRAGYDLFLEEIRVTQDSIKMLVRDIQGKKFISFHPSLSYFAREFGLVQLSLEEGGKEPAPAHIALLAKTARMEGIRTIYIQSDFDLELARTFAAEIGGTVRQVRPLDPAWSANLISIARQIRENP